MGRTTFEGLDPDLWWEGIRDITSTKRERAETKHRRRGPTFAWETPLAVGLGLDWRRVRNKCTTNLAWKALMAEGTETVLNGWSLKSLRVNKKPAEAQERPNKLPGTETERDMPRQPWLQQDVAAGYTSGWMLLITDNQAHANILNGGEEYRGGDPITCRSLEKSTGYLVRLVEQGWKSRDTSHDFILW